MAKQHIRRYIWLIDTIRSAGDKGITYKEINEKWLRSGFNYDGEKYAWRTFRDHLLAIADEFEIDIECDRRDNTYHIEDLDEYGCVKKTMVDALVLNNAIRERPDLNGSIVFNDNFHQEVLPEVVRAIKERTAIIFRYRRDFSSLRAKQKKAGVPKDEQIKDVDKTVEFEPYGVYYNTVWFAVGRNVADGRIHIYTLHRMEDLDFSFQTFSVPEDFNVKQYMTDYWVDNEELGPNPETEEDDSYTLECFEAGKYLDLQL